MYDLKVDESRAIAKVTGELLDDVRTFDFANAPESDIQEFLGYAYHAICDRLSEIYEEDIPY